MNGYERIDWTNLSRVMIVVIDYIMFHQNRGISSLLSDYYTYCQVRLSYMELVTLYAFIHVNNVDIRCMSILLSTSET